jgi:hypothetical protein
VTPLPGTKLSQQLEDEGRILTRDWSFYDGAHVVFSPKNFTPDRLDEKYWDSFRRFLSLKKAWATTVTNVRASRHPVDELFRDLFFRMYMRRKVRQRLHPFSGGIMRVTR